MKVLMIAMCSAVLLLNGCALSMSDFPVAGHATDVVLAADNFKILKKNAHGSSQGWSFLGLFPLNDAAKMPSMTDATDGLMATVHVGDDHAIALTNVVTERRMVHLGLFVFRKVTVRADVIEFK